jgi:multisubunit Na+/H+ antiporter MnhC subunit
MTDPNIADELERMEYEPLLPVEKKLIVWSIVIGVALCGFFLWVGHKLILR